MVVDRLVDRIRELGAPVCVGLDPRFEEIPGFIKEHVFAEEESETPAETKDRDWRNMLWAMCFEKFMAEIVDQICDIVPAVKLQIALYEQLGPPGVAAYFSMVAYARRKGLVVIGDIKRGDIASSAKGYSAGHIGFCGYESEPLDMVHAPADFVTLSPYLGGDSVDPFLEDCEKFDRGVFVLVKTSNKGSADIQDALLENGKPLYAHVAGLVSQWGAGSAGRHGYSRVGAVVGATHREEALAIRKLMPHTFFLVPGYGAQGGGGKDLAGLWRKDSFGMIVNSSRAITGAYLSGKFRAREKDFAKAAREAALDMKRDLGEYIE